MLTEHELAELERLEATATEALEGDALDAPEIDIEFIAAARNALPRLITAVREVEFLRFERDSLRRLVGRLQTGQEVESDYIDELTLLQAVHADCEAALKIYADDYNKMKSERDSALEALQYQATQHAQQIADLEEELEDWTSQLVKIRAERDWYLAALKREACEGVTYYEKKEVCDIGGITFRVTCNADGQLVAEEIEALEDSK